VRFTIDPPVFEKFPALCIGAVIVHQANNHGQSKEIIELLREREKEIRGKYPIGELSRHPNIAAWRRAYSSFGSKPSKYRSSVESLYRTVLKGTEIRSINKMVDIYNFISLKHMIPVGGDDLAGIEGDIVLKLARGDEPFVPLNSSDAETVNEGEVVYADARQVLCRRWNWRECDKTKMTSSTEEALLVSEALPPVGVEELVLIIEELGDLIGKYCGGQTRKAILNRTNDTVQT